MKEMNMPDMKTMLQIQPDHASAHEWEQLAGEENLRYEVLELSAPPAINSPERSERIRAWYAKSGRAASVHGAFIDVNPASGDEAFRELSRKRCAESCALAAGLGAENVVFHSSCEPFLRGAYLENWAEQCALFYEKLQRTYNLNIFIENSQDVDARPLAELMSRISNRRIGVCLDFGHANYSRWPIERWTQLLGGRIGYLHLSDNMGLSDDHLPLGEGIVDWEAADQWWRSAGRSMPMTLEVGGPDGVRKSLEFLRRHGYFGMSRGRT